MSPEKGEIKILFVEDLPSDVELAKRVIARESINFSWVVADPQLLSLPAPPAFTFATRLH